MTAGDAVGEGDARFQDAPLPDRPLRLKAESAEDLAVISSLIQDAVGKVGDIAWMRKKRRVVAILNRFCWENHVGSQTPALERVRSAISVDGVLAVRARGLDPRDRERAYELLAILFEPAEGCAGTLTFTLAGGGEVAVEVECLELALADLSQPWAAKSKRAPRHGT